MEYMVLFFTHSGAIKFNRKCKKNNIPCELMPVPRNLSSNCSVSGKIRYDDNIKDLVDSEIEKIFAIENNNTKPIYEAK